MTRVETDIVILTALGLEYDAVRAYLTDVRPHVDATGTRYEIGALRSGPGRVALALIGEGNLTAAAATGRAIDEFGAKAVILVGVAGGLANPVALGDVVVATRIHAYHGGRDEPAGFRPRPKSWPLRHALEQAAREVARDNTWRSSLSSTPAVHFKPIVSGEVVIDTRESELAKLIAQHYSDAIAVDMESAGVAEAAHHKGFANTITIRGISDRTDGQKRRADSAGWQTIAAANAAAFAAALAGRIIRATRTGRAAGGFGRSRTVLIGLGALAVAVAVIAAIIIGNQVDQGAGSESPTRGTIVTEDDQMIAEAAPRRYAHGPSFAPITGYLSEFYGSTGLERFGDDPLKAGSTMVVTVNSKTQVAAFDALSAGDYNGAVVALRPQTGEILAVVSTPSYDPNLLATPDHTEARQKYELLVDDPRALLLNRPISENYSPGSTFKLVVAAAALEDGRDKDTRLPAAPSIKINANTDLSNFNNRRCGSGETASMETALELSCNTAFAQLAHDLGEDKVREQAEKFGIGEDGLTVPMSVVQSCIGPRENGQCMDIVDGPALYQSGIGQRDVRLTPMQNAMIVATIANGGVRMRPQLIKHTVAPGQTGPAAQFRPESAGRAITESNAATLRDMMIKSEARTGGDGKAPGLTIASKTGTAETGNDPKNTPPFAWYVAFAPADNPKIAVAVVVESRDVAATGGKVSAAIGRATINAALAAGI